MGPHVMTQARRHLRLAMSLHLSATRKALIALAIMGTALYVVLFSKTPAVHDYFHHLRHDLMVIPCH